ncbi:MAG: nucleotide exchange factor GrpE [Candidatus Lloydbacteria bacterium RIFOXYC12_FULL_46_25]|uniref:Protein GrpE n=1 Tax=Candidatus Lloydbacteria bacterium RIFOXYC12_FULL_46_25 TaxID=1798670 RepID=A0A1G2E4J8_9BACT|nr:MAG: nucleotide exchange factor GrpE [Candidatus Lloydbacteria bacterium RIFOXYC12_FULL_46_25]
MDDNKKTDTNGDENEINLGGGVDIVQSAESIDDVEIESYNDDVLIEDDLTPQDQMKKLREKLRECVKEKQEYLDGWQRSKADFINYRKREEESKGEFLKFAREGLITDLLPALESFHMAFANKEAWGKVDPSWRTGVEYIHTQLIQILGSHGLTEINPVNEEFDPTIHTAVGHIETDDKSKYHKIGEVLQLGYRLNGKLISSPKVKIFGEKDDSNVTSDEKSK